MYGSCFNPTNDQRQRQASRRNRCAARSLDQAAVVIGRGFAHSERRPQLKHTYCSMISPANRSMVVSTRRVPWHFPHRVVCSLCITPRLRASPRVAYWRDRQCARIRHWVYPYEYRISELLDFTREGFIADLILDEALELGLALTIVLTS